MDKLSPAMNIKEVARRARVSTATVSRTINQIGNVKARTAERVWKVIEELEYYPNIHARTLVSGKSHMLGLVISDISNPFFPELVKSFEDMALQHNFEVIITNTNYQPARMVACIRRMLERKVDGVAVMTSEMDRDVIIDEFARRHIPIVFLDVGKVKDRISNIQVDYGRGIREAVRHLVDLRHVRIAFISGPMALRSARTRRDAFLKCLKEYGLAKDPHLVEDGNHKIDGGESAMRKLLALAQPPTAVLTSNDLTAMGALRAIHMAGLHVPSDISVIGFDDIDFSQSTQPSLTTVRLSRADLGRTAFEALHHTISGKGVRGKKYLLETRLVIRDSTGTVKARPLGEKAKASAT
jgi:DNA-binding LacI/PurR family transcriptional regulator